MIISNCPRCHEGFRVPSGPIPKDAYAHCPWCHETFPITDVLGRLPPPLEIVSADGVPLVIGESAPTVSSGLQLVESPRRPASVGTLIDDEVDDEVDDDDILSTISNETIAETIVDDNWHHEEAFAGPAEDNEARSNGDSYATLDGTETSPLHSMNVETRSGSRKRKGSGVGTFLGIVLGGLASVPIAGGLLALMGRTPDWGFWPFEGQQASSSVRAAAPLPPYERENPSPTSSTGTPLRSNRDDAHQTSLEPALDPADSAAQEIMRGTTSSPTDQSVRMTIGDQETVTTTTPSQADRSNEGEPGHDVEPTVEPATAASSVSPPAVTTATGEPTTEAADLALKASQMIDVMSQYQGDVIERNRRMGLTYQRIAAAAALADSPGQFLTALAAKIVASPLRKDIRLAGWEWHASKNRQSDGIALLGVVSASDQGTFLTSDSGEQVELISELEIPDGEELLVLGRLLDQGSSLQVLHIEPIPQALDES